MSEVLAGCSLGALLHELADPLVAAIGASRLQPLVERAATVPLDLTTFIGFEMPLGDDQGGVDLLVQVAPGPLGHLLVERPDLAAELGGGHQLADLLAALAGRRHPQAGRISDAWLEFDVGSGDAHVPSLFCHPEHAVEIAAVMALVRGSLPSLGARRALQRLVGPSHRVMQLGAMLSRPGRPMRLVLNALDRSTAAALAALDEARWPGDREALACLLDRYTHLTDAHSLAVGIEPDGSLAAGIGVELPCVDPVTARRVLGALQIDGAADGDVAHRALGWNGHSIDRDGHAAPRGAAVVNQLTRGRSVVATVRRLRHVKATLAADGTLAAKAYLGALLVTLP